MRESAVPVFDYEELPHFLSRREQKLHNRRKKSDIKRESTQHTKQITIHRVDPLTKNQEKTFDAYDSGKNLLLHGVAGTGKTFIALYLALREASEEGKQVVLLRSVVPGRDMGYLPGKMEEKIAVYEEPYRALCAELTGRPTSYDHYKSHEIIEFSTTSYLRGITFHDSIIIVDEAQNCSGHELDTIITRLGEGCRLIICGDFKQSDLCKKSDDRQGFQKFMSIIKRMESFENIEFTCDDIVRSELVKDYIITKDRLEITL